MNANTIKKANFYFWRTYQQKEIDLIEEKEGQLRGFEFKWQIKRERTLPAFEEFAKTYPRSRFSLVTPERLEEFLTV